MASTRSATAAARKTFFEQQRELLLGEIAMSFEQVLANINKLNRSLEAVVTVGNEFSAVEALWSHFEGVMGKDEEPSAAEAEAEAEDKDEDGDNDDHAAQHGDGADGGGDAMDLQVGEAA